MTFSSDLVFDGLKQSPYTETDTVNPLNIYGRSKALAEVQVRSDYPDALFIRTGAFFGPWDKYNFCICRYQNIVCQRNFPSRI